MKLIAAMFFAVMALMSTWVAAWLAIDVHHAWKVTTTISAFLFAIGALGMFMNYLCDKDTYDGP